MSTLERLKSNLKTYLECGGDSVTSKYLEGALEIIKSELKEIQSNILSSIEIRNVNYVKSAQQLDNIHNQICGTTRSLKDIKLRLENLMGSTDLAQEVDEKAKICKIKSEINALDLACSVFEIMSWLQSIFAEFDTYLAQNEFDMAADTLCNAYNKLKDISLDENNIVGENNTYLTDIASFDNNVFEDIMMEYLFRRGKLVSTVEKLFKKIFVIKDNEITVRITFPSNFLNQNITLDSCEDSEDPFCCKEGEMFCVKLQDIWYALSSVGILDEHIDHICRLCINKILDPLIEKCIKISNDSECKYCLIPEITREVSENKWSYKVSSQEKGEAKLSSNLTVYDYVIPVISSILSFLAEYCLAGNIHILSSFGKSLWSWLSRRLLYGLVTPNSRDGQLLRDLEIHARSLQLIPLNENTITSYVGQLETTRYEEKKIEALSLAREWIMKDDTSIVLVDDSTEIGSLTNLLKQCGVQNGKPIDKSNDLLSKMSIVGSGLCMDNAVTSIQETNESFLSLPSCGITTSTYLFVQKLHQVLDEAIQNNQKHCTGAAKQGYYLVRELVMLFIMLRPAIHSSKLLNDPLFAATFYTDCSYIIHHLVLFPFTYGNKLPAPLGQIGSFVDMILTLRKLQETAFSNLIEAEVKCIETSLIDKGLSVENIRQMSYDDVYIEAETSSISAIQRLKQLASTFSSTLAMNIYLKCFGYLVDKTIQVVLKQILQVAVSAQAESMTPDDASALALLLNNIANQIQRLFTFHIPKAQDLVSPSMSNVTRLTYSNAPSLESFVSYWDPFTAIRDTLDADIASVVQHKDKLKKYFQPVEIRGVLTLNPFLSCDVDEIYYLIMSSD
ncbi:hypothetical protein ACR3K2_01010 [Cryptosporidium serpentis]